MNDVSPRLPMKNSAVGKMTFCTPHSSTTRHRALTEICAACLQGHRTNVTNKPAIQLVTVTLSVRALATTYTAAPNVRSSTSKTSTSASMIVSEPHEYELGTGNQKSAEALQTPSRAKTKASGLRQPRRRSRTYSVPDHRPPMTLVTSSTACTGLIDRACLRAYTGTKVSSENRGWT